MHAIRARQQWDVIQEEARSVSTQPGQQTDFGANEWLVYEIHQQYLKDPDSVSEAWREFLSDYEPTDGGAVQPAAAPPAAALACRPGRAAGRSSAAP